MKGSASPAASDLRKRAEHLVAQIREIREKPNGTIWWFKLNDIDAADILIAALASPEKAAKE